MTYPKSHSKQGYHDARKAQWGDLFPFPPKGKAVERTRGVRKLTKLQPDPNPEGVIDELFGRTEMAGRRKGKGKRMLRGEEMVPRIGDLSDEGLGGGMAQDQDVDVDVDVDDADQVLFWRSGDEGGHSTISRTGQRRGLSSFAGFQRRHSGLSSSIHLLRLLTENTVPAVGFQQRQMSARPREQPNSSSMAILSLVCPHC